MKLYAYATPEIPKHAGYLKVGETNGDIDSRIKQQGHELNVKRERVWDDFIYTERRGVDREFRHFLKGNGFSVQKFEESAQEAEWVKCTVAELEKAFVAFRERFYLSEKKRQALGDQFYLELRNWYYWASASLPDPEAALRLVVRLLFCYFLKEKELVPENLFKESFVREHLKEDEEYRYYNAVLRNLFFHCLNTPIAERKVIEHTTLMTNSKLLKEQFDKIPFLNGGLFNEHDGDEVPLNNHYFFDEEQTSELAELGGKYKVAGIIRILSKYHYKLTLDEWRDQEKYEETVDPEFIGKVFESLLACIYADSKETRRKITGSYYTPREIVDYMVSEALDAYSKDAGDLLQCKILDPACGSGAFPCAILDEIMRRIDPNRELDQSGRYRRKLGIVRKVIYGVDIQPMAVQISQLRLFLSLIQEIVPTKRKEDNYGFDPLPNLETKFVCANTLLPLVADRRDAEGRYQKMLENPIIRNTAKLLRDNRDQYFIASMNDRKQEILQTDKTLQETLAIAMESNGMVTHETTKKMATWNPYDQSHPASYFDASWMFGINDGFDIVIGNPPYVFARNSQSKGMTDAKKSYYYRNYKLSEYQINLYPLFLEKGTDLLKINGLLCFITPNNWLTLNTNKKLRQFVLKQSNVSILNFYKRVFESAVVDSAIVLYQKSNGNTEKETIKLSEWEKNYTQVAIVEKKKILNGHCCVINIEAFKSGSTGALVAKIEGAGKPLEKFSDVKAGLKAYETGAGQPRQTEEMKKDRIYHSETCGKGYVKYLDGKDVCRYSLGWSGEYLKYGKHLAAPRKDWQLFSTPRILVRQIPSSPPYCINACYTDETLLNDLNSMNIVRIKISPLYLLGVLNSRVISYWFVHKFGKLQRGTFPQFKINELAQFPIPNISAQQQQPIITLVDKVLAAKKSNPATDTVAWEQKIDALVYNLYGLTQEEREIIEKTGQTK